MTDPGTKIEGIGETGEAPWSRDEEPLCRWAYEDRYGDHIEFIPEHKFMLRVALRRAVIESRLRAAEACLGAQTGEATVYMVLRGPQPWAGTTEAPPEPLSAAERAELDRRRSSIPNNEAREKLR